MEVVQGERESRSMAEEGTHTRLVYRFDNRARAVERALVARGFRVVGLHLRAHTRSLV